MTTKIDEDIQARVDSEREVDGQDLPRSGNEVASASVENDDNAFEGLVPAFTVWVVRRGSRFPMVVDSIFMQEQSARSRAQLLGSGQGWHAVRYSHLQMPPSSCATAAEIIGPCAEEALALDRIIYYGPYPCEECSDGADVLIVKAAREQGGATFDYPLELIYPNTVWVPHVHRYTSTAPGTPEVVRPHTGVPVPCVAPSAEAGDSRGSSLMLKAGTMVHVHGLPVELVGDTIVTSAPGTISLVIQELAEEARPATRKARTRC